MFGAYDEYLHPLFKERIETFGMTELRPAQEKALGAGLLLGESVLICTPTASGKTFVAELAMLNAILWRKAKAIYIVPLRALASEKFRSFSERYGDLIKVALSSSDVDDVDARLADYDLIVCTSEKLDALMRHEVPWLSQVGVLVVDEVHLLNDTSRGPTLEIVLTRIMRDVSPQIVALSATIGNPNDLASWLGANLVEDTWRPVRLRKGILTDDTITYYDDAS